MQVYVLALTLAGRSSEGACYLLLRAAGVSLPLFMQLTEQKERMTPPVPRLWSTSPVLMSVLQIQQLASLLCACDKGSKASQHRHHGNRITKSQLIIYITDHVKMDQLGTLVPDYSLSSMRVKPFSDCEPKSDF